MHIEPVPHKLKIMIISPRTEPRQARALERVKRILSCAEELLAQEGYEGFSTNRVAQKAKVNIASVYQYFPNKHALIFAINRKMLDEVLIVLENSEAHWSEQVWSELFNPFKSEQFTSNRHISLVRALEQAAIQSSELQQMEHEHAEALAQFYSRFLAFYGSGWNESDRLNAGRMIYAMCNMGLYDSARLGEADQQRIQQLFEMNIKQFIESILLQPAP